MRILIYTPTNSRAVDLQSVMELFVELGHEVYFLSLLEEGDLHRNVKKYRVKTFSANNKEVRGMRLYFSQVKFLAGFIRNNKIEVVFAHLQGAGLIAGLARWFVKFRLFYIRHNTDEHILQKSRKSSFLNSLTNRVAPVIIAPSAKVYNYLAQVEKISPARIVRINYGYNFEQYLQTDKTGNANEIRAKYSCKMLLASVARLIPVKRHLLMFAVVKQLVQEGMDVKLICLSGGPCMEQLGKYIADNGLENNVFLLGAQKNVFDYLEAADIFFHLSETEASNSAVKEAGFCKRTAIVCNEVGDFDDYIQNDINGYTVDKSDPVPASLSILRSLYTDPRKVKALGENLYQTIIAEFDISKVKPEYIKLLSGKN